MTASEEIRWEVDGHTIRIGITRLGDGPCVLMLPALSSISTKDELWPLQERLSSEYSTIAVDWPGFGDLPRPKIDWNPNHYRVFLRFLLDTFGSPKACVAAGHGAGYALWLAAEDPGCLGALYVLSPTWRGPLPTMTGKRLGLFDVMAKLGDLPVAGAGLYRANVNRFVVGMMARGHVYEEPSWFDVCQMQNKLKVIEAEGARHASLRFVCNNAAPMSFFNVFSHEPPLLILGMQARPDGSPKDTVANIRRSDEFVVHMVDMAIAREMIITGINFPGDVDEIQFAGLTSVASIKVAAPRIAESPCAMECRVSQILDYGRRVIVIGEVVQMYVRDECLDERGRYVRPEAYQPIARLHADNYIVADNQFVLKKPADLLKFEQNHAVPGQPS